MGQRTKTGQGTTTRREVVSVARADTKKQQVSPGWEHRSGKSTER